jgi:hypothetical protein
MQSKMSFGRFMALKNGIFESRDDDIPKRANFILKS